VFKRRTLFILGAGASAEVGLPVGKPLANIIGKKMDILFERLHIPVGEGDMDLFNNITNQMRGEVQEFQRAGWAIRDGIGFAQSIDDFLDQHRNDPHVNEYGKAAIVRTILEAERRSALYFGGDSGIETFKAERFADTWLVKFMYMLGRGIPRENVRQIFDNVAFIVFNYDRCIEFFLRNALRQLYSVSDQDAQSIVDDLTIIHPYGTIPAEVPFGHSRTNYIKLARDIKTYTDQLANADLKTQLVEEISRAQCIIFLGFAYHTQNIELLQPPYGMGAKRIYGTAYGMSKSDVQVTTHQLAALFSPDVDSAGRLGLIKLENALTAASLFDYYAKSLTGGD
jgi:hypothetical protein